MVDHTITKIMLWISKHMEMFFLNTKHVCFKLVVYLTAEGAESWVGSHSLARDCRLTQDGRGLQPGHDCVPSN